MLKMQSPNSRMVRQLRHPLAACGLEIASDARGIFSAAAKPILEDIICGVVCNAEQELLHRGWTYMAGHIATTSALRGSAAANVAAAVSLGFDEVQPRCFLQHMAC